MKRLTDEQLHTYVESVIRKFLPDPKDYPATVVEAMNYAMTAGGKRLRPTLMFLTYSSFKSDTENVEPMDTVCEAFMAAIEMIHTHSLVHDDLPALDNDNVRRGRPTVHVQFDESTAILAGVALLNRAYEIINNAFDEEASGHRDEAALLINTHLAEKILMDKTGINGMLGGQSLDVELSGKSMTNEERDYINEKKTAALIEAPLMIGACLAGADREIIEKLEEAGRCIGLAFQVQDDILDVTGDAEKLGKEVHQDERNEKNTFVSEFGLEKARSFVKEKSEKAVSIIKDLLPESPARERLTGLVAELVSREF